MKLYLYWVKYVNWILMITKNDNAPTISWCGKFQGTEADVVQSFIVNTVRLICVFYKLVNGEGGVVRLHNCVRYLKIQNEALLEKCMYFNKFLRQVILPSTLIFPNKIILYNNKKITFGEGTTEKVFMILSGYSSRILLINKVPIPEPVPPPKEWHNWNPWRQSQLSDSLRTTSRTESTSSAPSV